LLPVAGGYFECRDIYGTGRDKHPRTRSPCRRFTPSGWRRSGGPGATGRLGSRSPDLFEKERKEFVEAASVSGAKYVSGKEASLTWSCPHSVV